MALRFRRDVQKSSYYVWFLGAEEAKGFRGPKVIRSVLPYLIERATYQEPIKITLQVSHKGIKIIQGSSKNFIPHGAITSSIQIGDIVACVLLLYNPVTKCPLHVHAYRCDSETTAESLHQQFETLINRPENQKQFELLEARLGITKSTNPQQLQDQKYYPQHPAVNQRTSDNGHFKKSNSSSIESTTTSRDSECSGSLTIPPAVVSLPVNHQKAKRTIFDSLAAELKAKLNGGPPILLPPRDYDTVHRSKGNIFRDKIIKNNSNEKHALSRNIFLSPSSPTTDNYINEHNKLSLIGDLKKFNSTPQQTSLEKFRQDFNDKFIEEERSSNSYQADPVIEIKEEKIRPILTRPVNINMKLKNILSHKKKIDLENLYLHNQNIEGEDNHSMDKVKNIIESPINYQGKSSFNNIDFKGSPNEPMIQRRQNLTDKQKHLQIFNNYDDFENQQRFRYDDNYNRHQQQKEQFPVRNQHPVNHKQEVYHPNEFIEQNNKYTRRQLDYSALENRQRNSYAHKEESPNSGTFYYDKKIINYNNAKKENYSNTDQNNFQSSAKDRFYGAKEKFRLIERSISAEMQDNNNKINRKLMKNPHVQQTNAHHNANDFETRNIWRQQQPPTPTHQKYDIDFTRDLNLEKNNRYYPAEIKNAKSLNNLSRGYRHSYAEVSQLALTKANRDYGLLATHPF